MGCRSQLFWRISSRLPNYKQACRKNCMERQIYHYLFSPLSASRRIVFQPIPDIVRWYECHEIHYMPWQDALLLETGPWDDSPGLFLPTKILDLCFATMPTPSPQISKLIALLAWVKLDEVSEYFTKLRDQQWNVMRNENDGRLTLCIRRTRKSSLKNSATHSKYQSPQLSQNINLQH